MKHASIKFLLRLRWLYIAYSLHFVIGFLVLTYIYHRGINDRFYFDLKVTVLAGIHLLYEAIAQIRFYKRSPWTASVAGLILVLFVTIIAVEYTNGYISPYIGVVLLLTFLAAAYSQYFPLGIGLIFTAGYMLVLGGVFNTKDGGPLAGATFMTLLIGIIIGNRYFWGRRYSGDLSPELDSLNRSLTITQKQSNIILNAIEDGVVLFDEKGVIKMFNPGATEITGWTAEEAVGLDGMLVFKYIDDKGREIESDAQASFADQFSGGRTLRQSAVNLITKSQKRVTISMSSSPLIDPQLGLTGCVCIFRDITKERLEETQRAEFISTASHEMRTPVAAIEGYIALALNDHVSTIDSRAREYLEKAHISTQHLGKLFQDLLTSAKAEDGRLSSHPTVVEMGEYLQQITEELRFSADKKGLGVEFAVGSNQLINAREDTGHVVRPLYYVLADADRMREVITNVFDNAVKYTDQGKITIGLTGNNDVVQFSIRDTGPGIPAEDLPHLFQKFYRVDNSSTRTVGGTGLGLFICSKVVELYQGRIWAESQLGQGSTFFINLPRLSTQQAGQYQAAEASSTALPAITSLARS